MASMIPASPFSPRCPEALAVLSAHFPAVLWERGRRAGALFEPMLLLTASENILGHLGLWRVFLGRGLAVCYTSQLTLADCLPRGFPLTPPAAGGALPLPHVPSDTRYHPVFMLSFLIVDENVLVVSKFPHHLHPSPPLLTRCLCFPLHTAQGSPMPSSSLPLPPPTAVPSSPQASPHTLGLLWL